MAANLHGAETVDIGKLPGTALHRKFGLVVLFPRRRACGIVFTIG